MVNYWPRQHAIDLMVAALTTTLLVALPYFGVPAIITVDVGGVVQSARSWVGPSLTLLGMMSATTAFIFSVVDRSEFKALRELGVEPQLWGIFAENILWLAIAAVAAILVSLSGMTVIKPTLLFGLTFLLVMIVICLAKFAWVMRQIISVRASR